MSTEDDIDSQELDIFERESNKSETAEEPKDVGVITNLTDITQLSTGNGKAYFAYMAVDDKDNEDKVGVVNNGIDMLQSPRSRARQQCAQCSRRRCPIIRRS
jgi:hypothetical protein